MLRRLLVSFRSLHGKLDNSSAIVRDRALMQAFVFESAFGSNAAAAAAAFKVPACDRANAQHYHYTRHRCHVCNCLPVRNARRVRQMCVQEFIAVSTSPVDVAFSFPNPIGSDFAWRPSTICILLYNSRACAISPCAHRGLTHKSRRLVVPVGWHSRERKFARTNHRDVINDCVTQLR